MKIVTVHSPSDSTNVFVFIPKTKNYVDFSSFKKGIVQQRKLIVVNDL